MTKKSSEKSDIRLSLVLTLLLVGLMVGVYRDMAAWLRPQLVHATRVSFTVLAAILFEGLLSAAILLVIWRPAWWRPLLRWRGSLRGGRWALIILWAVGAASLFLFDKSQIFNGMYARLSLIVLFLGIAAWLATGDTQKNWTWQGAVVGALFFSVVFLFTSRFQKVTSHPFSLYWSEGNRLWDYSIPFGRRLYNYPPGKEIFSLTDIGRRTLWGLPYLLPGVKIWMVRLWDVLMFTVPYLILGWVVFGEERLKNRCVFLLLGVWAMLFLNQGPIYSPLVIAAILVVLGRKMPDWLNIVIVMVASYYARTSRFTWMFAPGMWAAMLAFVDQAWPVRPSWTKNWLRAMLLGVAGFIGGYLLPTLIERGRGGSSSQAGLLSVEGIQQTAGRQPLLWDRLLPNSTYAPGILLGLLIAVAPLLIWLIYLLVRQHWTLHAWQKLAAAALLAAFLAVGLVVSVKIGGGSNLHNLDMFLIGLLLLAGLAWQAGGRGLFLKMQANPALLNLVLVAIVLIPAAQVIGEASYAPRPAPEITADALAETQGAVAAARQQGEVLFLDQRQLLTFGDVGDVPLVVEYEKKKVMDEAMAADPQYFAPFYADLAAHRFSLIVSEPLQVQYQGGVYQFGNENDAWVRWVSIPMLCYYEKLATYPEVGVELLVPRAESKSPVEGGVCPVP